MGSSPALDLCWRPAIEREAFCELLHDCLDDYAPLAIQDLAADSASRGGWRVFFSTSIERDRALDAIRTRFESQLAALHAVDVPDEGWARRSQASLRAVRIGRIVVAPPWDQACERKGADSIVITIDPSMGFGTGHHETTRLCLELLQTLDVANRSVVDVGTGSGVLAIAAATLGARAVVAIDHDPDALENARENVERNAYSGVIDVGQFSLADVSLKPADIVTANLTASVLVTHATQLTDLLNSDGVLIASGFAPDAQPAVEDAFLDLIVRGRAREGAWAATAFVRKSIRSRT